MAGERSNFSNSGNIGNINQGGTQKISGDFNFTGNSVGQDAAGQDAPRDHPASGDRSAPRDESDDVARDEDRSRNVFVVYGRDEQARQAVFGLLRQLDLRPLEWEPLVRGGKAGGTPFLGQVVADAPSRAQAAVVVLTPDDTVMLHPELRNAHEDRFERYPALQPRPNVLLELGIVLAVYPENTIILEFGELRPIADLAGRNVIRFLQGVSVAETVRKVAGRLDEAGCTVNDSGTDWLGSKSFTNMKAYRRKPQ
jgi:predicted nucleotide-binding protein